MSKGVSLAISSWKFFWSRNSTDSVRGIVSLLRDRPVSIYLLTLCLLNFSFVSIGIIFLSFLFEQLLMEIFIKSDIIVTKIKVIKGCLNVYDNIPNAKISAKKYLVSKYIPEQYDDINEYFLKRIIGLFGINSFSIDNTVDLYHVEVKANSEIQPITSNLTCYPAQILRSYIFFNHSPYDELGAFQKFSLLHELAHGCLKFVSGSPFASHGIKMYFTYICFLFFLLKWFTIPIPLIIGFIIIILLAFIESTSVNRKKKLSDEILADSFALIYLEQHEREEMYILKKHIKTNDKELTKYENEYRIYEFQKNIDLIKENQEDKVLDNFASNQFKPSFLLLIATCSILIIPAFYSKAPDWIFFLILLSITIILFILFIRMHITIDAFHKVITERIGKWKENY